MAKGFMICFFVYCFCLVSGCTGSYKQKQDSRPCILSMNRMIHDCVSRIIGDKLRSIVLIDGSLDPHAYEMVKGDEDKIAESSLIFCNGLGLEHSLSLRKHLEKNLKVVDVSSRLIKRGVLKPLEEDGICDPHIWTDMSIWIEVVKEIASALTEKFPELREEIIKNTYELSSDMMQLDSWAEKCLSSIPENRRYLVSGHNAFNYFTRRYLASPEELTTGAWKARCISPEGLSPEAQISIRDIMSVVDYIHKYGVEVLFPEDTLNQDALKKIVSCLRRGHVVRLAEKPLYSDNVDKDYFTTFQHNVILITRELGGTVFERTG
ncbi:metal ABC transporter solute-binding protein, Zn/Mn family [Chlamydia sp. 17-3921]|uniref:metal ABC transporter solute-binding protein, Zn/Mn family n=1 Tax=Chlamydia sp. 17-3921 TaxID=2675798 RepID=UPI00351C4B5C